ncbi:hypothetical protein [Desulfovibrio desulfuricans]|uniref:hypothetical protein n=1 Tax=Desulfovibrio desulfuricans TaxID=876 RepID=UPI0035AFFA9A
MIVPPDSPRHDHSDNCGHDDTPALPEGANGSKGEPRVVDVEVLQGHEDSGRQDRAHGSGWKGNAGFDSPGNPFGGAGQPGNGRQRFQGRFFYHETFGSSGNLGGINFGRVWTGAQDQTGCLPPCITFALFMVCLAQFGFLAGIGFVFFHTIGSVMGVLRDVRQFSIGRQPNPWIWRLGNWGLSFLLTAWLAGAFN